MTSVRERLLREYPDDADRLDGLIARAARQFRDSRNPQWVPVLIERQVRVALAASKPD